MNSYIAMVLLLPQRSIHLNSSSVAPDGRHSRKKALKATPRPPKVLQGAKDRPDEHVKVKTQLCRGVRGSCILLTVCGYNFPHVLLFRMLVKWKNPVRTYVWGYLRLFFLLSRASTILEGWGFLRLYNMQGCEQIGVHLIYREWFKYISNFYWGR